LVAEVSQDMNLVIRQAPGVGDGDFRVDSTGNIYDAFHNRLMPGENPVGRWLRVTGSDGVVFVKRVFMDGLSGKILLE